MIGWWNRLTPTQRELIRWGGLALVIFAFALWIGASSTQWQVVPYCRDFPDQAAAQRYYRDHRLRGARLDADGDGIACERMHGPFDLEPVERRKPG